MRAVLFGFGNLGRGLLAAMQTSSDFEIVAIVDDAPELVGRSVADVLPGNRCDAVIVGTLPPASGATILFHAATSAPERATTQILAAVKAGYSVLSAAEWLFHPWLRYGSEADALDAAAKTAGTTVLGCGINPGFAFETLPILLSRTLAEVRRLEILRVSNVSGVGPADFAHLGFGLSAAVFAERVADGSIEGHMGFPESVAALAECVGIAIDTIADELEPTLATQPIVLPHRTVAIGEVAGITQTATGSLDGVAMIVMKLEMFLDPEAYGRKPQEAVAVEGSRSFQLSLSPAAPPVAGAAAMMVHAARALPAMGPGVVSLLDQPISGGRLSRTLRAGPASHDRSGTRLSVLG
jgi:4-hydroxy-tetrahydrodipicolinate reductase